MRTKHRLAALLCLGLAALPLGAAVKAMNLAELMGITADTLYVRILDKTTFRAAYAGIEQAVFTRLRVQGESLRTGAPVEMDLVFLGSHDPADRFGTSEMPMLQDTRAGAEAVIFYGTDEQRPELVLHNFSYAYRVERAFGQPVVIGKGEGFAFPANATLADVRQNVRDTHLKLEAQKAAELGNR